jgi:hypothetical protein
VRTASSQGTIILLNFDLINSQGFLLFTEYGIKYPEIKKMINITNRSRYIFTNDKPSDFCGSTTTQNESIPWEYVMAA